MNAATKLTYKELQAALKSYKEQGLTGIKLNSKQSVLQEEYERITTAALPHKVRDDDELGSELVATAIDNGYCELTCEFVPANSNNYPFCSNTVKVVNQPVATASNDKLYTTKVIPAMNSKYAPSWLCKPYTVYVIDGIEYFSHELEAQLQGQVCELPAPSLLEVSVGAATVVNERKLQANQPPRLQVAARKDRVSKARPAVPIVNSAKDLPKVAVTFKAQEQYNPYFIDSTKAAKYSKSLGDVEKQAARNLEDAIRGARQGLRNVIDFAKGFHARQVERAMKTA